MNFSLEVIKEMLHITGSPPVGPGGTVDLSAYPTTAQMNAALSGKADASHTHSELHAHSNKSTLDKLGEANGKLTFNGAEIAGAGTSTEGGVTIEWLRAHSYVLDDF